MSWPECKVFMLLFPGGQHGTNRPAPGLLIHVQGLAAGPIHLAQAHLWHAHGWLALCCHGISRVSVPTSIPSQKPPFWQL